MKTGHTAKYCLNLPYTNIENHQTANNFSPVIIDKLEQHATRDEQLHTNEITALQLTKIQRQTKKTKMEKVNERP